MPFGNITTFYLPIAGSAGSSQWGTDVRKLLSSADGTADSTTTTQHGTAATTTVRTFDPYTASSTDATEADYGWAVTPADMNSVSGAKRFFSAGNHVATVRMGHNALVTATGTLTMFAYRVGSAAASRARTLLGSASASVTLPATGQGTFTVTLTLGDVVFEPDETIQYSFEFSITGIIVTGRLVTFYTGTQGGVQVRIDTPVLRVLADTTGTASGSATTSGVTGKVLGAEGSAAGSGTASGSMSAVSATTGTASGDGVAVGAMSAVAGTIGTAAGLGSAQGTVTAIGSMTGTASGQGDATGVLGAIGSMTGAAAGTGAAEGVLSATAGTVGTAAGASEATGLGSSVAGAIGTAAGTSAATGLASIVLGTVGTVAIGAPTTPDYPITSPTKHIAGVVTHHETGALVSGATLRLFRTLDDAQMQTTTSTTGGAYEFLRDADDPYAYYVVAEYDDAGTQVHGVTDRGLVPTLI